VTGFSPSHQPAGRRGHPLPRASARELRLAEAAAVGVMAIWAGNFVVVKAAFSQLPPVGYASIRFLIAGLLLLGLCRWREGSVGLPRRDILPVAALGAVGFGIYQVLWSTALSHSTAGNSALIIGATPILTMLVAVVIGSDTFSWTKAAGALVSFVGLALVIGAGAGFSLGDHLVGDLMTLVAALCWACYVSFGAPVLRRHSPLRTSAWTILSGTAVMAPLGLWQLARADLSLVTPTAGLAIAYSAVLAGALGNVVVFEGIRLLGPTRITNLQFLPPALAVILAAIFLGETIRPEQVAGGLVIVLGILLARRAGTRPRRLS